MRQINRDRTILFIIPTILIIFGLVLISNDYTIGWLSVWSAIIIQVSYHFYIRHHKEIEK